MDRRDVHSMIRDIMASKNITLTINPELEVASQWTSVHYPYNMRNSTVSNAMSFSFIYADLFGVYDFFYNDENGQTITTTAKHIRTVPELNRMLDEATNLTMIEGIDE